MSSRRGPLVLALTSPLEGEVAAVGSATAAGGG